MIFFRDAMALLGGSTILLGALGWASKAYIDHRLERRLAEQKGALEREAEMLRFALQRDMLKAQLGTDLVYKVAPRLLVKMKRAHGAVSTVMGLSFAPNWGEFELSDVQRALEDRDFFPFPLLAKERREILEGWGSPSGGIAQQSRDAIRKLHFQQQVQRARIEAVQARNYAVLNSVFMTPELADSALSLTGTLLACSIDAEAILVNRVATSDSRKAFTDLEAAGRQIGEFEKAVRKALSPSP